MSLILWAKNRDGDPKGFWLRADGPPTKAELKLKEVANVQGPTVAWARRNGIRATKLQGVGNRSQPDYLFRFSPGYVFLIEFKRPGEVPTPLQTHSIGEWLSDGFKVEVHDTKESAIDALRSFQESLTHVQ